jgi:integrase
MSKHLTDAVVKGLPRPATGNLITYDKKVKGFGIRVTANGHRGFILNYRTKSGRSRRYTIGAFPEWQTTAARDEAKRLKQEIDRGGDPVGEVKLERSAPTMADLAKNYLEKHASKKRDKGKRDKITIEDIVLPILGANTKVAEISSDDADKLHQKVTKDRGPIRANRVRALASNMFALAEKWKMRPANSNPCRHVTRNHEEGRQRYLQPKELLRLMSVLSIWEDQKAADVFRFLLYTGARLGETLKATWTEFELDSELPTWTKPSHHTKTNQVHAVALSLRSRCSSGYARARRISSSSPAR